MPSSGMHYLEWMLPRRLLLASAISALILAPGLTRALGQSQGPEPGVVPGSVEHGRRIYSQQHCGDCHALTLEQDQKDIGESGAGRIRSGHALEGAPYRGTWWGGRITTDAGDASDFCLLSFVDPNSGGFGAPERKALVLFMQDLGAEVGVAPLVLLRRDEGDVDLGKGDAARGRPLYARACAHCHPGGEAEALKLMGDLSPMQAASVIRRGSGRMAFFQIDRLSAPQVADIAAYLESVRESAKR
ncbi:MAG TPA: c-type cytochrome [Candidatus Polarisedimenticolia bacterium]|nr:c-type cytochrome [Candidatus Polarisedimenticolia bacterium]